MPLSKPQAVLFDWDNTLVEGWKRIHFAINEVFKKYDLPLWSELEVKQRAHRSAREIFPLMFKEKAPEVLDFFYSRYHQYEEPQLVLDGTEEILKFLNSNKIYSAVISNKHGDNLRKEVGEKGFTKYFGKIVGSRDAVNDKPSSEPVKLALEGSGINLGDHVWIVGDSTIDMLCAKNSCATPVLYGDKIAASDLQEHKIKCSHVNDHYELLNLLKSVI